MRRKPPATATPCSYRHRASPLPDISADNVMNVFRIKLVCEFGRVRQVAEHHGELAAFGVGSGWFRGWQFNLGKLVSSGTG
jgi:hypothetical protein